MNVTRTKQRHSEGGPTEPPAREVTNHISCVENHPTDTCNEAASQTTTAPVCVISEDAPDMPRDQAAEIPIEELADDTANVFTCMSELFKPGCVEEIQ